MHVRLLHQGAHCVVLTLSGPALMTAAQLDTRTATCSLYCLPCLARLGSMLSSIPSIAGLQVCRQQAGSLCHAYQM